MLDKYGYIGRIISGNAQYLEQAHSKGLTKDTVTVYQYFNYIVLIKIMIENVTYFIN